VLDFALLCDDVSSQELLQSSPLLALVSVSPIRVLLLVVKNLAEYIN